MCKMSNVGQVRLQCVIQHNVSEKIKQRKINFVRRHRSVVDKLRSQWLTQQGWLSCKKCNFKPKRHLRWMLHRGSYKWDGWDGIWAGHQCYTKYFKTTSCCHSSAVDNLHCDWCCHHHMISLEQKGTFSREIAVKCAFLPCHSP